MILLLAGLASAADPDPRVDVLTERVEALEARLAQIERGTSMLAAEGPAYDWANARFSGAVVYQGGLYGIDAVLPELQGEPQESLRACLAAAGVPYIPFNGSFYVTSGGEVQRVSVNTQGTSLDVGEADSLQSCVDTALRENFSLPEKATRAPTSTRVSFVFESSRAP